MSTAVLANETLGVLIDVAMQQPIQIVLRIAPPPLDAKRISCRQAWVS